MELSQNEIDEMKRLQMYFPFRKISAVKDQWGKCEFFANATFAKANNYARKTGGIIYRLVN